MAPLFAASSLQTASQRNVAEHMPTLHAGTNNPVGFAPAHFKTACFMPLYCHSMGASLK
jgi:hypothetical protein